MISVSHCRARAASSHGIVSLALVVLAVCVSAAGAMEPVGGSLPNIGLSPQGGKIAFGLYTVLGNSKVDPSLTNMQRVAEAGFTMAGPYYGIFWDDFSSIYEAAEHGLSYTYQIRPPAVLNGVTIANRSQVLNALTNAQMAASVREQLEAVLSDPIARNTVSRWSLGVEEVRYWHASEMRYLEVASGTIRQVEQEFGVAHRPFWMYEPGNRNVEALQLTGGFQDIVSKGTYLTDIPRGPLRAGNAIWGFSQTVEAAQQLDKLPQGVFQMNKDFSDPMTGGDPEEIRRVIRHDVYLGLALGLKSLNVWSMYENRPNFETHNDQFLAYASVAQELTGPLNLQQVFLAGQQTNQLTISVIEGLEEFDYTDVYNVQHTYDTLHTYEATVGNVLYLLLVNSTEQPMTVSVDGLAGNSIVEDFFHDGFGRISSSSLNWELEPLGVSMLAFQREQAIVLRAELPEASSILLMGGALGALGCCRHRRTPRLLRTCGRR